MGKCAVGREDKHSVPERACFQCVRATVRRSVWSRNRGGRKVGKWGLDCGRHHRSDPESRHIEDGVGNPKSKAARVKRRGDCEKMTKEWPGSRGRVWTHLG